MIKAIVLICLFLIVSPPVLAQIPFTRGPVPSPEPSGKSLSKTERLIFQAEYEFMKTRDPATNALPENIKERELNFVSKLPAKEEYYSMRKNSGREVNAQTRAWKQRGPWNCGGRFLCIAFDVQNEKIINAGAASGGMCIQLTEGIPG